MRQGIGSGGMGLLFAAGLIAVGCLSLHPESKDAKGRPATERSHEHGKPRELSSGGLLEEKKGGTILMIPKEELRGE